LILDNVCYNKRVVTEVIMVLVEKNISVKTLKSMSEKTFGDIVKAVVDVEKEVIVVDADMHSDQEEFLLEHGSEQRNLWGINLYPDQFQTDNFIEFDSMINLRPSENNKSRGVENETIRENITSTVNKLVTI
jgi:hypothetical protein